MNAIIPVVILTGAYFLTRKGKTTTDSQSQSETAQNIESTDVTKDQKANRQITFIKA